MQLIIVSPEKKQHVQINWIEFNTPTGNYIIQPGHAPTILKLSPRQPLIYCLNNGKQEIVMIEQGIAEITRQAVTVLMSE